MWNTCGQLKRNNRTVATRADRSHGWTREQVAKKVQLPRHCPKSTLTNRDGVGQTCARERIRDTVKSIVLDVNTGETSCTSQQQMRNQDSPCQNSIHHHLQASDVTSNRALSPTCAISPAPCTHDCDLTRHVPKAAPATMQQQLPLSKTTGITPQTRTSKNEKFGQQKCGEHAAVRRRCDGSATEMRRSCGGAAEVRRKCDGSATEMRRSGGGATEVRRKCDGDATEMRRNGGGATEVRRKCDGSATEVRRSGGGATEVRRKCDGSAREMRRSGGGVTEVRRKCDGSATEV